MTSTPDACWRPSTSPGTCAPPCDAGSSSAYRRCRPGPGKPTPCWCNSCAAAGSKKTRPPISEFMPVLEKPQQVRDILLPSRKALLAAETDVLVVGRSEEHTSELQSR